MADNVAGNGSPGERSVPIVAQSRPVPRAPPPRKKRRWVVLSVVGAAVLLLALAATFYYFRSIAPWESTDDAFIEGHVTYISPRVAGPVINLLVDDNQIVKAGQSLLEIDPRDYETRLASAHADVAAARGKIAEANAQITAAEANVEQRKAAVAAAEAEARRAEADLQRYESAEERAVSRSQLDLAQTQARSATANLEVARSLARAAEAQVALSRATAETAAAQLKQALSAEDQANLDLSYTRIVAPLQGRVTRRTVEKGAFVEIGQALLAIVPEEVWVTANFKETQIREMRPGQPVQIRIDAFPQREFRGKVDSFQAGTGSRFTLLPPENAVGNYVKVVQRVPVKIVFAEALDPKLDIAPGMSVVLRVRVK